MDLVYRGVHDGRMTLEEAARDIRLKIAVLRYLGWTATESREVPDADVFAGIATVCEEVQTPARAISSLPGHVLNTELKGLRER